MMFSVQYPGTSGVSSTVDMCSAHCLNLVNGDVIGSCSRLGRGFTNSISYDLLMDLDLYTPGTLSGPPRALPPV